MKPLLSVIVISHNQREKLRRCLDSILAMQLPFAHEIIVSDDRSQDGTCEMLESIYSDKIIITHCNSDECNPAMTSERAGYNRIYGLKIANGKYIIHVDGDDFFIPGDTFKCMIDVLEHHPECNLCIQNYRVLMEGNRIEDSACGCSPNLFAGNPIISAYDFVRMFPYIHNSACCARRSALRNVEALTGCTYDDIDITYQYIGKGNVALIDRSDYVYVRYNNETASHFPIIDQRIQWASSLFMVKIAPQLTGVLLKYNLNQIYEIACLGRQKVIVSEKSIRYLSKFNISLLKCFDNKYGICEMWRINAIWGWIRLIKYFKLEKTFMYRILYRLAIAGDIDKQVCFDIN